MKQRISAPVAVGIVVIVLAVVAVTGWRYMTAGSRDKFGHDLQTPGVQPSNMGDEMQRRMNAARSGGQSGASSSTAASQPSNMNEEIRNRINAAGRAGQVGGTAANTLSQPGR